MLIGSTGDTSAAGAAIEQQSSREAHAATLEASSSELERIAHQTKSELHGNGQLMLRNLDAQMLGMKNKMEESHAEARKLKSQVEEFTKQNKILHAQVTLLRTDHVTRIDALMHALKTCQSRVLDLEAQIRSNLTMATASREEMQRISAENEAAIIARCENQCTDTIRSLSNRYSSEKDAATAALEAQTRLLSNELAKARELIRQQNLPDSSRAPEAPSHSQRPGYPSPQHSGGSSSRQRSPDRRASPEHLRLLVQAIMMSRGVKI